MWAWIRWRPKGLFVKPKPWSPEQKKEFDRVLTETWVPLVTRALKAKRMTADILKEGEED